ncbi:MULTISPECIES: hypothetical protein [unclassified Nocardioides]|uniref:hypothetical protein n=1 Tax=unclassified Nocardioides TaxID=2615069 RepID=UPI003618CA0A
MHAGTGAPGRIRPRLPRPHDATEVAAAIVHHHALRHPSILTVLSGRRTPNGVLGVAAVTAAVVVLTGCGDTQRDPVVETASGFYAALAAGDSAAACAALAPRTRSAVEQSAQKPCEQAILEEDIPGLGDAPDPDEVSTFGTSAQVRWAGETTFLSRFRTGWRVVAAGCVPEPEVYDCQVEAG